MDAERRAIAAEVLAAGREYDALHANRLERLRNVAPDTAELLGVLVRACRARRVLEIGTSNGYSTLWLADAVQSTDGQLETLELDPRRVEQAERNLERAGLGERASCRTIGAAQALAEYPDDAWDLIFLDAERPEYAGYWSNLRRVLAPGGTLTIDNAISHAAELSAVDRLLHDDPSLTSTVLTVGDGLIFAVDMR